MIDDALTGGDREAKGARSAPGGEGGTVGWNTVASASNLDYDCSLFGRMCAYFYAKDRHAITDWSECCACSWRLRYLVTYRSSCSPHFAITRLIRDERRRVTMISS